MQTLSQNLNKDKPKIQVHIVPYYIIAVFMEQYANDKYILNYKCLPEFQWLNMAKLYNNMIYLYQLQFHHVFTLAGKYETFRLFAIQ